MSQPAETRGASHRYRERSETQSKSLAAGDLDIFSPDFGLCLLRRTFVDERDRDSALTQLGGAGRADDATAADQHTGSRSQGGLKNTARSVLIPSGIKNLKRE